jgi:hypothetical protein
MKNWMAFFGAGRRRGRWVESLRGVDGELRDLAGRTEGEFLGVGERLQDYHRRASEIAAMAASIPGIVSGEGGDDVHSGLQRLLDRMSRYLSVSEDETARVVATLTDIKKLLATFDGPLEGFRKVVRILRIQGISTRIESARLGGGGAEGFETVADHVEKLARLVEEKIVSLADQQESLDRLIESRLASVDAIRRRQQGRSEMILEETRTSIGFLASTHQKCAGASLAIAGRSEGIARNIAEVVMSMQFHDITRQQLEHVSEAVEDVLASLGASGGSSGRSPAGGAAFGGTAEVCLLQAAHLVHARDSLAAAISRIRENLLGIARNVGDMSSDAREMSGTMDKAGHSFLADMEEELGRVTGQLSEAAEASRELATVMSTVSSTAADMLGFVDDVERFGSEIELIALNASIKATRSGTGGDALRVLAESIQVLSKDARRHASAVAGGLRGISGHTERFGAGVGASADADGASGIDGIRSAMSGIMGRLHSVDGALGEALRRLDEATVTLSEDIERTVAGIESGALADEVIGRTAAALEKIAAEAGAGRARRTPDEGHLRELEKRYTMEQEREVHRAISEGRRPESAAAPGRVSAAPAKAAAPQPPAPPSTSATDDSLGDNVELF